MSPLAQELNKQVVWPSHEQNLRSNEDVRGQGRLQHNGHVGGVEQSDWVQGIRAPLSSRLNGDLYSETLQVHNGQEHEDGGQNLEHIGQVLSVECLQNGSSLVRSGAQKMEQGDHCTIKLGTLTSRGSGWSKSLPHDFFAHVGSSEQGNTRAKPVTLLQQFIQQNHDNASKHQLQNQQQNDPQPQHLWWPVHACQHIHGGLAARQHNRQKLLGVLELLSFLIHGL